jgi:predicted transcriptional regulator
MSTVNANTLRFISLRDVSRALGARSRKELLKDLRALTPQEKREVADLVKKGG